jgi:hypothetical protein
LRKLPFRLGYGIPLWLYRMLVLQFYLTIFSSLIVFGVIALAMYKIKKFIEANKFRLRLQKGKANSMLIILNIVMSLFVDIGLILMTNDFRRISDPFITCS